MQGAVTRAQSPRSILIWYRLTWINLYDGKLYELSEPGNRLPFQAEPRTYGDVVHEYRWHPEANSLAPDGGRCTGRTAGLLRRTPVIATREFATIGKETNRRWEREDDISLLNRETIEYRPNETEKLVTPLELQRALQRPKYSIRKFAKFARVSPSTVKAAKRGRRIRKKTAIKLTQALKDPFT